MTSFNLNDVAKQIASEHTIIYCAGDFYEYRDGCYRLLPEEIILKWTKEILKDNFIAHRAREVIFSLKTDLFVEQDKLNKINLLNLKNGLFDIKKGTLESHSPDIYSTIQLDVNYNSAAKCLKWQKTLDEIFERHQGKIGLLQEYFGLCLTQYTHYEKALICIGEGANGKSTVLYVLFRAIGEDRNCSAVSLDMLRNSHYKAELYGKLVNISIETRAKTELSDDIFKAVVTGDPITADRKYKDPITFRPFCKLVFAFNEMPRVDDRTNAFYRRLLLLGFTKEFKEQEQNKNLKFELIEELDGIFLWALEGLKRLENRGYFAISENMKLETEAIKRENNNTIDFVDECCVLGHSYGIQKQFLYARYSEWCERNGDNPLTKIMFGKEMVRQFKFLEEIKQECRYWLGVQLKK